MKLAHKTEEQMNQELLELRQKAAELEKLNAEDKRMAEELREARHELEIRVKVRTAEITKANEDLHREIVERKRMQDVLQNSESQYRTALDSMADPIHVVDEGLCFVLCNKALLSWNRQLGLEADSLIGKTVFEIYPFLPDRVRDEYRKVFDTGKILITEEHTKFGGRVFITETRKIPVLENGKTIRVITAIRDITEREDSEGKFRVVVNCTADGFWIVDMEGKFIDVNPAICRMLGYSREEMLKMKIPDIEAIERTEDVVRHIQRIQDLGADRFETKHRGKDGKIIDVEMTTNFMRTSEGSGRIFSFVRDISERKQARERLERLNKEILESNKRLEQLAVKDSHTGLYNHRYLEEIIEVEFDRAKRYGNPFSVIMIDIDYFKSINDVYGHHFGDMVLKQIAEQLKKGLRRYDVVIRYGGEEFVILSPLTDRSTALILAQRILETINLHNFGDRKHTVKLKLSIAVAAYPEDRIVKGINLIELADQMLNRAKESGGNRVYSFLDRKKGRIKALIKNGRESNGVRFLKDKIGKLNKRASQSLIEAIFAFAKTIELKDKHTGRHVEMTVKYATEVAKRLGLSGEEIENIREASILHDLGKIGISERILLKKSKLTKEEFDEIKKHPQIGVDIIRPLHFLHDIIPLILYHHEWWDGKGYPAGLKGEDIPIGARIIAVADVYQALISSRPYRKAYAHDKALKIIKESSGTHFDPKVVNTFLEVIKKKK